MEKDHAEALEHSKDEAKFAALDIAKRLTDIDEDEHWLALVSGMDALVAHALGKSGRFEKAIHSVAAQLRKAYERGYNDRLTDEIAGAQEYARERAEKQKYVYFIRSEPGEIKIGLAIDVEKRLRGLQTSHPYGLTLLAFVKGGQSVEREYHRRFAAHRLHGEWFEPHPDILAEIAHLSAHPQEKPNDR